MSASLPLIFLAMLFVMVVLPQRRRMRQQQALLAALGPGERVLTAGGIYGVVLDVKGDVLVLSVGEGTILHVSRRAIAHRVHQDDLNAPSASDLGVGYEDEEYEVGDDGPRAVGPGEPSTGDSTPSVDDPHREDPQ